MHQYLPAIGFSKIKKRELENLLQEITLRPDYQESAIDFEGNQFVELRYMVADNVGLVLRGIYNEDDEFILDYYYPKKQKAAKEIYLLLILVSQFLRKMMLK